MTYAMAQFAYRDVKIVDEALEVLEQFGLGAKRRELAGKLAQGERSCSMCDRLCPTPATSCSWTSRPAGSALGTRRASWIASPPFIRRTGHGRRQSSEHDMDIVFRYSDRIVVMHKAGSWPTNADEVGGSDDVSALLLGGR